MVGRRVSSRRLSVHVCEFAKTSESNLPKLPPNATFLSRVRRNFQKLILVSVRHPFTRFYLRSHAAISFEKKRHGRSSIWWVIHPCSEFRFYWDILMTCTFLYIFIMVPYIICFWRISKNATADYWHPVYPAYVICLVDIALNFITGFASPDGHEIFLDPLLIVRHYTRGYFFFDLISSVPYTWFYPVEIQPPGSNSILVLFELLPLFKIVRISTLKRYMRQMDICNFSHTQEMTMWMLLLTLLIFHWSACVTFIFPYFVMHVKGSTMERSGVYQIETELNKEADWKIYLIFFHFGVSNLVGSSFIELDNMAIVDKAIRCILLLLGKGYMIYLIVIFLQLLESSAEPELKYQQIMREVREYSHEKKLPAHLRAKLFDYYEYRFQGSFFKEIAISHTLSKHLNQEILINVSRGLLDTAAIFHNLPRNVIGNLMSILKSVIYLEDDIVYKSGNDAERMYFVVSGTVALITFSGKEICHERDGGFFGEAALIYPDRKRQESAIALEVCEFLSLDRRDFKRIFPLKSDFYIRLEQHAKERWEKINELNEAHINTGKRRQVPKQVLEAVQRRMEKTKKQARINQKQPETVAKESETSPREPESSPRVSDTVQQEESESPEKQPETPQEEPETAEEKDPYEETPTENKDETS